MSYRFLNERMTVFRENDYPKLISGADGTNLYDEYNFIESLGPGRDST
jgi:hypothetical protein